MRHSPLRACALSTALLMSVLAPASAPAQSVGSNPCSPLDPFDLSFPGGTLKEYIAAIQQAQPCANIMLERYDYEPRVPAMSMRQITALVALNLVPVHEDFDKGIVVNSVKDESGMARAIRVIAYDRSDALDQVESPAPPQHAAVFSLAEPLALGREAGELLGAIEVALGVFDGPAATVKFHEPTGLLIVRSASEQLAAVSEVIDQLRESAQIASSRRSELLDELEEAQMRLLQAEAETEHAKRRLETHERTLRVEQQKAEAAEVEATDSLQAAELQVASATRDLHMARAQLLRFERRTERIEAELARLAGKADDLERQ